MNGQPFTVPKMSFSEFMLSSLKGHGDKECIIDSNSEKSYTCKEVVDLCGRIASGLIRRGMKAGEVLYMCSRNCAESLLTIIGTSATGGVIALANPLSSPDELKNQLTEINATYIVVEKEQGQKMVAVINELPSLHIKEVFVIGEGHDFGTCFEELMQDDGNHYTAPPKVNPEVDALMIFFSSGTTGVPKPIVRTHCNSISSLIAYSNKNLLPLRSDDVTLLVLPLFHTYGYEMAMFKLILGGKVVTVSRYMFQDICRKIEKFKVTFLPGVPSIFEDFNQYDGDRYNLNTLRMILNGGDMLNRGTALAVKEKLKLEHLIIVYGTSETGAITLARIRDLKPVAGHLLPLMDFKVIDLETGVSLGPQKMGELCVKGPMVMKGYLKGTLELKNVLIDDGWFRTGDCVYFDEDGLIYLVGRKKNIIKYKGYQVSPCELESILLTHEAVASAAVVGVPDKQAGALPRAYITLKPGYNNYDEKELLRYVANRVAPHKRLRGGILVVDDIPKSTNGKICRKLLEDCEVIRNKIVPKQTNSTASQHF